MCDRPSLRAEFDVDVDDSNRPILCGRLVGWFQLPQDSLPYGTLGVETFTLDGVHLVDFNKLVLELVRRQLVD